jgi:hypothetical protein
VIDRPGSTADTRYGPLPSGGSSVVFVKSRVAHHAFGSTGSWPMIKGSSRLTPLLNVKRTRRGPAASTLATWA